MIKKKIQKQGKKKSRGITLSGHPWFIGEWAQNSVKESKQGGKGARRHPGETRIFGGEPDKHKPSQKKAPGGWVLGGKLFTRGMRGGKNLWVEGGPGVKSQMAQPTNIIRTWKNREKKWEKGGFHGCYLKYFNLAKTVDPSHIRPGKNQMHTVG